MRLRLAALLLAALLLPTAPGAEEAGSFTPAQRQEIVRILRDALKTDPTILRDAVLALQAHVAAHQEAATQAAIARSSQALGGLPGDPVAGNPSGSVTMVEFYDIRCPYCRRMLPEVTQLLDQDHGIRLVLKDLPVLGEASRLGARALLAAQRQGGYLKLQQVLMTGPAPTADGLRAQVEAAGLDWTRLQHDMADPAIEKKIGENLELARDLGIDGTPAFVIGGKLIPGAVELAELKDAVAAARAPSP